MSTQPNALVNPYGQAPNSFGYVDPSQIATNPGGSYGGSSVYGSPQAAPAFSAINNWNVDQAVQQNQNYINSAGQQINQEAQGELATYGPLQQQYQQEANSALNQLGQTPGYTPGEASQINQNYSQFNTPTSALNSEYLTPTEQTDIYGNPQVGAQVTDQGISNENAQLGAYQQNLSGQLGNYANYTGSGLSTLTGGLDTANQGLATGLQGADQQLQSGLQGAQSGFSSLNSAVNNPALQFDPNNTEQQITPAEMQEMQTAAGQRIGAQYGAAEGQLYQNAANAGNTSPLALAAANARLQTQESSDQGNAETNARIAALQAQEQQATSIEQQREAAAQAQTGFKAGAATTEQAQAQNAAALAGTTGVQSAGLTGTQAINSAGLAGTQAIGAGEAVGQAGINAANQYGSAALGQQNTETGQQYGADTTAEQLGTQQAATIAGNRQATDTSINNTLYNQGVGSAQATAQGAATTGNARIQGQQNYLSGVTGEQSAAQTGGQNAVNQQQNAYATQTSGLNAGTATAANSKANSPSVIGDLTSVAGAVLPTVLPKSATGDVITKPEIHLVGEKGPELIKRVGRYRSQEAA